MIAYLEKHDTTVDLPDDIGQKDIQDINENFHSYVDPQVPTTTTSTEKNALPSEQPLPKWQPNLYESVLKPAMSQLLMPIQEGAKLLNPETSEARAFAGKTAEGLSFGALNPLIEPLISQAVKDRPAEAVAGEWAGGLGSLLMTGGALRIAGLGEQAAVAGKAVVEAGLASGERFIPKAIMGGATFGTRSFIARTVKAFQDGGVDMAKFGRGVLKDTAFGATFAAIGGMSNAVASVSSAGALGFISSKMDGADNREASLNAAIWAAFETVGSVGKTAELRLEALRNLKGSLGEYVAAREPGIPPEQANNVASQFVDHAVRKAGFETAEDLAKSGPENLLEGIEKVNQAVRTARVPGEAPKPEAEVPKLPEPEEPGAAKPQDIQDFVDAHAEKRSDARNLIEQSIYRMQQEAWGEEKLSELSDVSPRDIAKTFQDETYQKLGASGQKYFDNYLRKLTGFKIGDVIGTDKEGNPLAANSITEMLDLPSKTEGLEGTERGLIILMNEANQWAKEQKGPSPDEAVSDTHLAQMAYNRGLIEEPNADLMKLELPEAKEIKSPSEGETKVEAQISPTGSTATAPPPKAAPGPTPKAPVETASLLKESSDEISHLVAPANAAPLAAQITREQLGKMARSYDMAEAALNDAKGMFDKQPKEINLDFIDRMEHGQEQATPELTQIAGTLRKLLDDKRQEIKALGTGKLEHFIENYFPHIWDQGEKQISQAAQKAAKRPFEGSKGFLKKRSIETTKQGIEAGLTPVSYNPVDLSLLKIREMDKYLAAHRTIKEYKANGLAKYVKIGGDVPEGWQKIDDRISTVFKSPMVAVQEAFDTQMMAGLNQVAKNLGIDLERNFHTKEGKGQKSDTWGLSFSRTAGEPGKIWTKFAGPESALAHELGHQLDNIFGLQSKFLSDPKISKELTKLANERAPDGASPKFKEYIQSPSEKMAVMMEAYIHAPELFKDTAPRTYKRLVEALNSNPKTAPLTEVKPSLQMGVNKGEVYAGGAVIAGHIYAQPDAARIINNYLSPGLQKSAIFQAYRYAGNAINQFQLGFSAFHLGFTSLDATISKFALGLNELASGHPVQAIKKALASPFAPVANIIRGNDLLKAWKGEGKTGIDNILAEAMAAGGGRARMDQFYATKAYDQLKHHFEAGNVVRGLLHIPLSLVELSSKPILEYIVPRQKLGVFADIMKMEMQHNPGMSHVQMRQIAQRAWDSVDNRMGQLVYDNLFWNRTFKDLLMGSVRSVGWNLGTIREVLGGAKDYAEAAKDTATGKKPEFTYRMAYVAALPIVTGILGAMTQYLMTGKGPQELKDYWFPKSGGVDANGNSHRVSLPSYMKDLYHWRQNPGKVALDKLQPILHMMGEMLQNKDYFGTKIRNEDDPLVKQVTSEASYMLGSIQPFSVRNMEKNRESGNTSLLDTIGPWVGITPAPYDINQTKAEKVAHDIAASHQEVGGRTQEQVNRSRLMGQLTRAYKSGDPKAQEELQKAFQSGQLSRSQVRNVILHAGMTPLQRMTHGMSLAEVERVYAKATPEEKGQLDLILRRKQMNEKRNFIEQGAAQ